MKTPNHYFPGVYKFQFPFSDDHRNFGYCDVEISIGNEGRNNGTSHLVTVLLVSSDKSVPALEHYIEKVATNLRFSFFGILLSEKMSRDILVMEDRIQWIQSIPFYKNGILKQVRMKWSEEEKCYYSPVWEEIS